MKRIFILFFISALVISTSAQSTITWSMGMDVAPNTYSNMHPRIVMDGTGNPMLVWGRMTDEAVFFSKLTGTAFSTPVKLNPSWLTVATASWMGPDLAAKGDTVYVVVKRTPESSDTNHTYILRSFNGGSTFSVPVQIEHIADSFSRFPTVSIDDSGNPVVAFMKFDDMFMNARWAVTRSLDYGNSFSPDTKASGWSGVTSTVCDCCPGSLVLDGSTSAMIYRDNLSNIRDMWVGISSNGSNSFDNGCSVDNTNWMINTCPSSGPDGVIIGDTLYSVFMSAGSGNTRSYLSKSSISNVGVNSVTNLTGNIPGLSQQNYPRIDKYGKAIAIVWKQSVSGNAQVPILFTRNVDSLPFAYDTITLTNATNADVAVGNGKVFVVWEDDNSGTVKYRSGTFSPDTVTAPLRIATSLTAQNISAYPNPTSGKWNITGFSSDKPTNVTLYDAIGNTIQTYSHNNTRSSISIGDNSLSSGCYILKVSSPTESQIFRLIKD